MLAKVCSSDGSSETASWNSCSVTVPSPSASSLRSSSVVLDAASLMPSCIISTMALRTNRAAAAAAVQAGAAASRGQQRRQHTRFPLQRRTESRPDRASLHRCAHATNQAPLRRVITAASNAGVSRSCCEAALHMQLRDALAVVDGEVEARALLRAAVHHLRQPAEHLLLRERAVAVAVQRVEDAVQDGHQVLVDVEAALHQHACTRHTNARVSTAPTVPAFVLPAALSRAAAAATARAQSRIGAARTELQQL